MKPLPLDPSPATGKGDLNLSPFFPSPLGGEGLGVRSIQVKDLSKSFKKVSALNHVSLNFESGYMHGIIGPEGAGKTTLMRLILGLLKPDSGEIIFNPKLEKTQDSIAYMPQQQSLYADLSIDEHLNFFKDLYSIPKDIYQQKREELLHMMRLSDFADRPAGKLSGGMYKKLGLMCALLRSPKIILLDEPTNGVDPISRREFWNLLYQLADQNILILLTTSYMDEAERCGQVHFIEKGLVMAAGDPKTLLKNAQVKSFNALFSPSTLLPAPSPSLQANQNINTLQVSELTVQFGNFTAVDRISFRVPQGEIFGFLGANGAGKTTTIRVLCGLLTPTSGHISVPDKSKIGYMSQRFTLYPDLSVEENLDFIASLRKLEKKSYLKHRQELFELISFEQPMQTLVQNLSGGIKQQVALAAALLHDPEIIFLDEPTAGVSPASRERFWALIQQLAMQGKTVFVTTHYMDEAEHCQRIALMQEGKIIALDSPHGLKKSTFQDPMFEFEPKQKLSFQEIFAFHSNPLFSFFEPYGLRFHASVKDISPFESQFHINSIEPSLEDVFIRAVEYKKI